jgi:hypothetical protein
MTILTLIKQVTILQKIANIQYLATSSFSLAMLFYEILNNNILLLHYYAK